MKQLFLTLSLVMSSIIGFSQEITQLTAVVDEMSNKTYWVDPGIIYINEVNQSGFRVSGKWKYNSSEPIFEGFTAVVAGIGSCVENVEVIVLFENGDKITKTSWNKFNCDGDAWYSFTKSDLESLTTLPIKKIRFTNGRSYESVTGEVENPNYFIEMYQNSINGVYETVRQ